MSSDAGGRLEVIAQLSHRLAAAVDGDDVDTAAHLVAERGRLVADLKSSPELDIDPAALQEAVAAGDAAIESFRERVASLRESLESIDHGRAGLSAYSPGRPAHGRSCDIQS